MCRLCTLWALILSLHGVAFAATFTPLGYLPEGSFYSVAYDVNSDGTVVVGRSNTPKGAEAFRWTRESGMVGLSDLPGGDFNSEAHGVSDDGNTVVGLGTLDMYSFNDGFVWHAVEGIQAVGSLDPNEDYSYATGVSGDGSTVVGDSSGRGFIWNRNRGIQELRTLDGAGIMSRVADVSTDGKTVVGQVIVGEESILLSGGKEHRFSIWGPAKWSEQTGTVDLGAIDSEDRWGRANAISRDGQFIVGWSGLSNSQAFRWSQQEGTRPLADSTVAVRSSATGVSDAGDVVVGYYRPPSELGWGFPHNLNDYAFLWTESSGFRPLHAALKSDYNLSLNGWILGSAHAISGDGKTIVGVGVSPTGATQAWVLSLEVPEPQTMTLAVLLSSHFFISRNHNRTLKKSRTS